MQPNRKLMLMIDGDNAEAKFLPQILTEVQKYGVIKTRRVYGDWSKAQLDSWKDILHIHALNPTQQFNYTPGKNATDMALTVDAMDLICGGQVDGICIVSSDSDYTPLVTRIRSKGLFVMAIGRKNTPRAFVGACDVFVYTEDLQVLITDNGIPQPPNPAVIPAVNNAVVELPKPVVPPVVNNTVVEPPKPVVPPAVNNVIAQSPKPVVTPAVKKATPKQSKPVVTPAVKKATPKQSKPVVTPAVKKATPKQSKPVVPHVVNDRLTPLPNPTPTKASSKNTPLPNPAPTKANSKNTPQIMRLKELLQKAFTSVVQPDGWAYIGEVGSALKKLDPTFKPQNYECSGFSKLLVQLAEDLPDFIKLKNRRAQNGGEVTYVQITLD